MNDLREAFFEQVGEVLVIFDKDLRFADVNQNFLKTINLKREQIIGKHITQVSPGIEETTRYLLYLQVLRTGEPIFIDETRTHPSLGNYISRINVFKVGEGIGMAIQNITDLKEAVDELETFIYKSSHDLRSPISTILGLANLAIHDVNHNTTDFYFKMVKKKAEELDFILSQLMETASIRKEEKTIHLIDFNEIIKEVKKSLAHMDGFHEIRFQEHIDTGLRFYSDKRLLNSILQNLLDNAIKYKQDRADAFVKIVVTTEEGVVKITVVDNGIGIMDQLQENVFNMFFRATEKAAGAGLGLYTVKYAVRKLGGHITLNSKQNEGTTFTVYLPNEKIHDY
jgi:PAS domain S-box-containing protein